jgi:alpha-glucosidase
MGMIQKALLAIRFIGIANMLRSIRYAVQRDRLDARTLREPASPTAAASPAEHRPGWLLSVSVEDSGARFVFDAARLQVRFVSPDMVFIGWDDAGMHPSWAITAADPPRVDAAVEQLASGEWSVRAAGLEVRVGVDGSLAFLQAQGRVIRREKPIVWTGSSWTSTALLEPDAVICGLGERAGPLDLRPGSYRFWNRDPGGSYGPGTDPLYIAMPVYMCVQHSGAHLVFHDTSFDGNAVFGEAATVRFEGGPARSYIGTGTPAALLERFTGLTGRPPLPPRWALGYQQSRWGYRDEAEIRRIWGEFKRYELPLGALVLDIDHQRRYRTFTLDTKRFPRLPELSAELAAHDVHLVAIVDPGVKRDRRFDLYARGCEAGAFVKDSNGRPLHGVVWPGPAAFPDFTDRRARAWWGTQYARHLAHGIDGFWHDMNEPAAFAAWGDGTLPLGTRHDMDGRRGDHREAHNIYGLLMNAAGFEGLRALQPEKRPFIVSRSGWVGMQRHAWSWTGDTQTSWDMLRQTIPTVLGLGLCGQGYTGPDIGGFSGSPTPELFARWFELASFMPFFRTHSAFFLPRREPWEFGEEVLASARNALELRSRLIPYWYTLAWQASHTGAPLIRPLFWADPADERLRRVDDAFMLGDALLIAPVLKEGARTRTVRLPKGEWYAFGTDRIFEGGAEVEIDAPLQSVPVLARAGSIVADVRGRALTLHVHRPEGDSACGSVLYMDAGDGYGGSRVDRFDLQRQSSDGYRLRWSTEGDYPWPYESITMELHGFSSDRIIVDGNEALLHGGRCGVPLFADAVITASKGT